MAVYDYSGVVRFINETEEQALVAEFYQRCFDAELNG